MPQRKLCQQCKSYDIGMEDPADKKWYCQRCWSAYAPATAGTAGDPNTGNANSRHPAPKNNKNTNESSTSNKNTNESSTSNKNTNESSNSNKNNNENSTSNKNNNNSNDLEPRRGGRRSEEGPPAGRRQRPPPKRDHRPAPAVSLSSAETGALRRLKDIYESTVGSAPLASLCSSAPRTTTITTTTSITTATTTATTANVTTVLEDLTLLDRGGSFVAQSLHRQRPIAVTAHSGEPLSPRGDRVGGTGRSVFQENRKVPLELLLSSVDDIVSQIYVHFDEVMTQIILNELDRVTACETQGQRDAAKVRAVDELLQSLGTEHCDLFRCIMHRPRDIFLRLLEEFCTLEDEADPNNLSDAASSTPQYALTVRFLKTKKKSTPMREVSVARNGEVTDQRWLAHMTQRYRQLTRESELDQIFKRDLSLSVQPNMPSGSTVKQYKDHLRIHIPAPVPKILPEEQRVCIATTLPEWTHPAFLKITHLNTIQSTVFRTAFHTSQNMLLCAPTGAGKTVCALLVMLRCISEHFEDGKLDRNFKIIFIAPMKALAQEMVENFSSRLAPFAIVVRELTGDMQLTKREIAQTQVIVTTPEKWDVITRKQSNEDFVQQVRLIVIDEIHLLNEDRGPVLEAIVARTLRQGEIIGGDAHLPTRLVGLSATLPNYKDVANFLCVDLSEGLKVFTSEYRPVPLEQTFVGLLSASSQRGDARERQFDQLAYTEVVKNVRQGHQVMVFVHSRKQTVGLAKYFMEEATRHGHNDLFRSELAREVARRVGTLQGRDLSQFAHAGFGAHHAGLIRYDRTTTEDLFRKGHIRVLICTSTLAWGVNLPAHTVIIRGTQLYDPKRGGHVNISVLDVMQIFGRAGRPQYDTSGHGIIISDDKDVAHYLRLLSSALPIESQLQKNLCDHLNAEVQAGTVSSIAEGTRWLEYTYMWQRVRVNPLIYGLQITDVRKDPQLKKARYELVAQAAEQLANAGMIRYNPQTGAIDTTDLGRIASHYYISHESIKTFNEKMRLPDESWIVNLNMGSAMNIVACASEFSQLRVRQEELDELRKIHLSLPKQVQRFGIVGESADETNVEWKVTTLMKAYISRIQVEMHSLASDINYVVQNAPRITRALLEIEMQRGHPITTSTFLMLCKCLEQRTWEFEHPLKQFNVDFTESVYDHLEKRHPSISMLQEMSAREIGSLVRNQRFGGIIAGLIATFPRFDLTVDVQPITRTILRVKVTITPAFTWNSRYNGSTEPLWLFVEDQDSNFIFHSELLTIKRKEVETGVPQVVNISVPIVPEYDMYSVQIYSDRWLGCQETYIFSISHLHLPDEGQATTQLLPLAPLRREVIPAVYHSIYEHFPQFNAVQTQVFHAMFHTDSSIFLGAPTGSGKTIAAEMAILRVFEQYPGAKVVYIAPLKALVKERLSDWMQRFQRKLGRRVVELSGDVTPDISALIEADILCTTPEKWDGLSRSWQVRSYVTAVRLVIFDEVHMLGSDRGPILEVIVSRMRYIGWHQKRPIRLIGLSTAVANPGDLSSWLGVDKKWSVFNFDPSVRPVPMRVYIAGYHGRNYCPRMATMNKPTYNAICERSPNKPVIVFVSSRRQTRLTAMAIIGFLLMEQNTAKFVRMDVEEVNNLTAKVSDPHVKHCMQFGVGIHHAGLLEVDRVTVENAFLTGKLQILVATSTLAWGVNFPAHMVVVKGTEYYDGKTKSYVDYPITDVLQMIGRAGRPQFDTEGVAQVLCHEPKKGFYRKFLYDPFPVESALHRQLHVHINAEIVAGTIETRQDAVDYLTWTYLFRRITKNPSYYGVEDSSPKAVTIFLSTLVAQILDELEESGCIEPPPDDDDEDEDANPNALICTVLGRICSYYYLSHRSVQYFDQNLLPDSSQVDVLRALCEAREFNELPVRHNEDKLNITLSQSLPLPINTNNADSPHVKALLLFQAHFERGSLPIADYYTDQRSTLDNAVRVVQAMVDISANSGHLYTALRCMTLLQCIVQGLWWHSSSLLQIPHVTSEMLPLIKTHCGGIEHAAELANAPLTILEKFRVVMVRQCGLTPQQTREAMNAVCGFPLIDVQLTLSTITDNVKINEGELSYELTVHLTRLSLPSKHVVAPRFTKPKDEQYWLVVGNEQTGELVALKRVNRMMKSTTASLRFEWDDEWADYAGANGAVLLNLYLVCDSYIGLDQQYSFDVRSPPVSHKETRDY